jgi:azurin
MKITNLTVSLIPAAVLLAVASIASLPVARADNDVMNVKIVANDSLKFSVKEIDATPGQTIHVQLTNEGTLPKDGMGHNWILLDSESEAGPYATTALSARSTEYEPKALASHVLASIPLLGPKETGEVTFCAPTKPGKYPYICSCSGHSMAGMKGYLIVK